VASALSARATVLDEVSADDRRRWSIWTSAALVCSRLAAVLSVRRARSSDAVEISPAPPWISVAVSTTVWIIARSVDTALLRFCPISRNDGGNSIAGPPLRSPVAIVCSTPASASVTIVCSRDAAASASARASAATRKLSTATAMLPSSSLRSR